MTYLIWKVNATTGEAIRAIPILYPTLAIANAEAAVLNGRRNAACRYVCSHASAEAIDRVSREHAE